MTRRAHLAPYAVAALSLLVMIVAYTVVAEVVLARAVQSGALPGMPGEGEHEAALSIAFGSPAAKLGWSVVINCAVLAGIAIVATRTRFVERFRLKAPQPIEVFVGVIGLLCVTASLDASVSLLGWRDLGSLADIRKSVSPLSGMDLVFFAALIGLGPGVAEELLFRGYLLNRMCATQSVWSAVFSSSLLFGLFHMDAIHSPLAFVMGLYLACTLLYTGSFWVPVAAHTVNNALATVTTDWAPNYLQAGLLLPVGFVGGLAALFYLRGAYGSDPTP